MVRLAKRSDRTAIEAIAIAIGFEPAETAEVLQAFDGVHAAADQSQALWLVASDEDDRDVQGVAYVELERMTEGTYNLLWLAVHPTRQKQGLGTALVRHVEHQLPERGAHLLLVETMGTADFAYVRQFYARLGFMEEARIRDFYGLGYDKVIFSKALR